MQIPSPNLFCSVRSLSRGLSFVLPIFALALLTACIGAVPFPTTSKVENGTRLKGHDVAFIRFGHTTRAEVVDRLGFDFRQTPPGCRAIAYSWELQGQTSLPRGN